MAVLADSIVMGYAGIAPRTVAQFALTSQNCLTLGYISYTGIGTFGADPDLVFCIERYFYRVPFRIRTIRNAKNDPQNLEKMLRRARCSPGKDF
jgi:hypothetical protein